jgi:hypothetical protein
MMQWDRELRKSGKVCASTWCLEKQYWEMDGIVPDVVDSIVVNLSSDNDSEGSTSSSEDPD